MKTATKSRRSAKNSRSRDTTIPLIPSIKRKPALHRLPSGRILTLFSGQWADLKLDKFLKLARKMGYQGVELACWGDHFNVNKALTDKKYIPNLKLKLRRYGLECHALSSHLVGQAVCDNIDERHKQILPDYIYGDGKPEGVRKRAAEELIKTGRAAKLLGVTVINGFTGSRIWHLVYSFPPNLKGQVEAGYVNFAKRFKPILDAFQEEGVRFALEVHPTEIAFDIASAQRALEAVEFHPAFGFNYDPSHFGYQGVDYVKFIHQFKDHIFHVHMKDVAWGIGDGTVGVFGGHVDFHQPSRYWDFKSVGRGMIKFELIIRALNHIGYAGPLSVEWEDGAMDRVHGATESAAFIKKLDFPPSKIIFDAQFAENSKKSAKKRTKKKKK